MPSYLGQASFTGELIHSKQYKTPRQLDAKRVLVVGGGNSACTPPPPLFLLRAKLLTLR
jgi:cation diffusion facilitator CzcD-associated flavoprotein CzcO